RGTRTAFTFHVVMAATLAWPDGPSKIPHPCAHAYSVPERFTPSNTTGEPTASTIRVPATSSAGAATAVATRSCGDPGADPSGPRPDDHAALATTATATVRRASDG